jgi:hypothetical protein
MVSRLVTEGGMKCKVNFSVKRAVRLYRKGKNVSEIADAFGNPPRHGNNRLHNALIKAGVNNRRTKAAIQNNHKYPALAACVFFPRVEDSLPTSKPGLRNITQME